MVSNKFQSFLKNYIKEISVHHCGFYHYPIFVGILLFFFSIGILLGFLLIEYFTNNHVSSTRLPILVLKLLVLVLILEGLVLVLVLENLCTYPALVHLKNTSNFVKTVAIRPEMLSNSHSFSKQNSTSSIQWTPLQINSMLLVARNREILVQNSRYFRKSVAIRPEMLSNFLIHFPSKTRSALSFHSTFLFDFRRPLCVSKKFALCGIYMKICRKYKGGYTPV